MTNQSPIARTVIEADLPSDVTPEQIRMALGSLLDENTKADLPEPKIWIRVVSPALEELGLPVPLNQILTARGITTPQQLAGLGDAELLGIEDIHYPQLYQINSALAGVGFVAAGKPVAPDDALEHLNFREDVSLYEALRRAGIDSVSALAALDIVGMKRIRPDLVNFAYIHGVRPAPVHPDRKLGDLIEPNYDGNDPVVLDAIAAVCDLPLAGLTAATLTETLQPFGDEDDLTNRRYQVYMDLKPYGVHLPGS